VGRPVARKKRGRSVSGPFSAQLRRSLRGVAVRSVVKLEPDRVVRFAFADGRSLILELVAQAPNLVLLDPTGRVAATARRPKRSRKRLQVGEFYRAPEVPAGLLQPLTATAAEIDEKVASRRAEGSDAIEAIRRAVFGVSTSAARLVLEECSANGQNPGKVLRRRLDALFRSGVEPVIESPADPLELAERGEFDRSEVILLPWPGSSGTERHRSGPDAAATAGLYYEASERAVAVDRRSTGLRTLIAREIERLGVARARALADRQSFEDPALLRRRGEALLAGLTRARRVGEVVFVPDPYDPEQGDLAVPVPGGRTPEQAAGDYFRLAKRSERGLELAARRGRELADRRLRLERVGDRAESARSVADLDRLEEELRAEGLPVGLEQRRGGSRSMLEAATPRVEGVRLYRTARGETVLAGRGARENQRLTFKLASPDDFWLHAKDAPGAHVVLKNPDRRPEPSPEGLAEAAAVAAWFSDLREQDWVDVQWTRRKNVRKPRGGAPGTVVIKRYRTLRVRPCLPTVGESDTPRHPSLRGKDGPECRNHDPKPPKQGRNRR
jgi:predicted ribosome quality control (RQC) complex YloA/Tae2 family protein